MSPKPARPQTLPHHERLHRRPDIVAVQDRGRRQASAHYLLLCLPRRDAPAGAPARLGITVSKKVGNAVVRNRVKRWVRETYRRCKGVLPPCLDVVVIARPSAATSGYAATASELRALMARVGTGGR